MPNQPYTPIEPGENNGREHPREDGLHLHANGQDWINQNGRRVCGAKRHGFKEHGLRCGRRVPEGRCHYHGGKSLKGPENPNFKTGRHSKYLPKGLKERYEALLQDPELSTLRDEIALVDVRIGSALQDADELHTPELWERLAEIYEEAQQANRAGNLDEFSAALGRMGRVIQRGQQATESWGHVMELVDQRRKLSDSENRRIQRSEHTMDAEEVSLLIRAITDVCLRVFREFDVPTEAQQRIADEARIIFGGPPAQA